MPAAAGAAVAVPDEFDGAEVAEPALPSEAVADSTAPASPVAEGLGEDGVKVPSALVAAAKLAAGVSWRAAGLVLFLFEEPLQAARMTSSPQRAGSSDREFNIVTITSGICWRMIRPRSTLARGHGAGHTSVRGRT